ncbi:MAG: tetratricopeptide repeat protein [Syntrophothermus sp.]
MPKIKTTLMSILLLGFLFVGFQCSSTEMTSAKLYIQQKNYDKALESLNKEVQKNPKSDEGYYYLGVVYGEKENFAEMAKAFEKSLSISNKFAQQIQDSRKYHWVNLFNKGVGFYQKGTKDANKDSMKINFDKSINAFNNAILVLPDSSSAYKNLAFVYLSSDRLDEAIEPLQILINKDKSAEGYRYLGEILYNKGTELKDKYKTSKNPQDSIAAQDAFNRAITVLEEGRKNHPGNSEILLWLSNSYIGANKIDIAIDAFKAGVEAEPNNKYYRYNYGVLLLGANQFEPAVEQFKKAIEIDPNYQNAIYNLAVTYVKWGTVINKEADEKGVMQGNDYKDKYTLALPYLEQVVKMNPKDAAIWELLGKVYTVLGDQQKAKDAFDQLDKLR